MEMESLNDVVLFYVLTSKKPYARCFVQQILCHISVDINEDQISIRYRDWNVTNTKQ